MMCRSRRFDTSGKNKLSKVLIPCSMVQAEVHQQTVTSLQLAKRVFCKMLKRQRNTREIAVIGTLKSLANRQPVILVSPRPAKSSLTAKEKQQGEFRSTRDFHPSDDGGRDTDDGGGRDDDDVKTYINKWPSEKLPKPWSKQSSGCSANSHVRCARGPHVVAD